MKTRDRVGGVVGQYGQRPACGKGEIEKGGDDQAVDGRDDRTFQRGITAMGSFIGRLDVDAYAVAPGEEADSGLGFRRKRCVNIAGGAGWSERAEAEYAGDAPDNGRGGD